MEITIDTITALVPEEHRDLVFRFSLAFSRFECALKRAVFTKTSRHGVVEANWDSFSSRYRSAFDPSQTPELRAACDYFEANPRQKQILDAGLAFTWSAPQFRTTEPLFTWLVLMLRSVRNNLFHGGKYPISPFEDPSRNPDLLRHSLAILDACLHLDRDVERFFSTDDL